MPTTENLSTSAMMVWNYFSAMKFVNPATQYENGLVALPALALGGSTTITVPLSGTFPDTNYVIKCRALSGTSVLSMIQITNVVKNVSSAAITVRANGLASIAGILLADAYRTS